jgi:hypothetical protein
MFFFYSYDGLETPNLCLDGIFTDRETRSLAQFLHGDTAGIAFAEGLSHGASLLRSQVERLVFLALVQLTKILLCLLVHDNVAAGDGLTDDAAGKRKRNQFFFRNF